MVAFTRSSPSLYPEIGVAACDAGYRMRLMDFW